MVGELTGPLRRFRLVADLAAARDCDTRIYSAGQPPGHFRCCDFCGLIQRRGH
jgi:hypothetical protein